MRSSHTLDSGTHASAAALPEANTAAVSAESCAVISVATQSFEASSKSSGDLGERGRDGAIGDDDELLGFGASAVGRCEQRVQVTADPEVDPRTDEGDDGDRPDDGHDDSAARHRCRRRDGMTSHGHSKPAGRGPAESLFGFPRRGKDSISVGDPVEYANFAR